MTYTNLTAAQNEVIKNLEKTVGKALAKFARIKMQQGLTTDEVWAIFETASEIASEGRK